MATAGFVVTVVITALASHASTTKAERPMGPGAGPWEIAKPEEFGLSGERLRAAEEQVNKEVDNRNCMLVTKNGKIVYETYHDGRTIDSIRDGYSITKSMCASLFGIAVEEGWADVAQRIADRDWNTRQCNPDATFQAVLAQVAMSKDLNHPEFTYDYSGILCLDVIEDFIRLNNPLNLTSAVEWKDLHWEKILGMEHTQWGNLDYLSCGFGARISCRDAARFGQLWVNNGIWPGHGQLINKAYVDKARKSTYPHMTDAWGGPYGYTLWLWAQKQYKGFDPSVVMSGGSGAQCIFMSELHNAVVVSFGEDEDDNHCDLVWKYMHSTIVPANHTALKYTESFTQVDVRDAEQMRKLRDVMERAELPQLREYAAQNIDKYTFGELQLINKRLAKLGGKPITIPQGH